MLLRLVLPVVLALLASSAHAWGTQGHHVIANLAYAQLSPKAKAEVDRLLAIEPGATLASISTWADETCMRHARYDRHRIPYTDRM